MLALTIIEKHQMDSPVAVTVLEKLLRSLKGTLAASAGRRVMDLLLDLIGRRVAPLSERRVWECLCLPEGLFRMLDSKEG